MDSNKRLIVGAAVAAAVVAIIGGRTLFENEPPAIAEKTAAGTVTEPNVSPRPATVGNTGTSQSSSASVAADDADEGNQLVPLHADASGELVVNEQTRLNIEALIADNEPNESYAAMREQTENLPPAAARRAEELLDKFISYQKAQRQSYPPGNTPLTAEDAVRELEGLHALREAYFGAEVARRLYGKEEARAREMIELMRVENDPSLTTEEKRERGLALRERLPGIAAIEKSNRDSAATQTPPEPK